MPFPDPKYFLESFRNLIFVETGSNHGDGIQCALDSGFDCIYSVDLSPFAFGWCCSRFLAQRTKVHLFHGDSRQFLRDLLPGITTRITFWLDAHECGSDAGDANDCPLLEELQIITEHPLKDHMILIDDVRLFGMASFPTLDEVRRVLLRSNPYYEITFADSADFPADILVAVHHEPPC